MTKQDIEEKRKYIWQDWQKQSKKYPTNPKAVIEDIHFRNFSNWFVSQYLNKKDYILDCGCGNGYATAYYSDYAGKIIGLDYTPQFIKAAQRKYSKKIKAGKLEFVQGNILDIPFPKNTFDKVISERTLINLPSWQDQQIAIKNYHKILKKGGFLLMTEITLQGHAGVDKLRNSVGLDIIKKHKRNVYLDETLLDKFLAKRFKIVEKKHFGTYMLISKILHPLLVAPKEPKFLAKINETAAQISKEFLGENLPSHVIFYVLKKNA